MDLSGLQGNSLPHHSLHHSLQKDFCSSAYSVSSPTFFTDLGVCFAAVVQQSFPLLKYVLLEVQSLSPMGLALASGGSVLELAALALVLRGSF